MSRGSLASGGAVARGLVLLLVRTWCDGQTVKKRCSIAEDETR